MGFREMRIYLERNVPLDHVIVALSARPPGVINCMYKADAFGFRQKV
jgi:hypothetical protein